jgi:hypothetical protein
MSNVSLHTFTLGDIPPRVFGIKVTGLLLPSMLHFDMNIYLSRVLRRTP